MVFALSIRKSTATLNRHTVAVYVGDVAVTIELLAKASIAVYIS